MAHSVVHMASGWGGGFGKEGTQGAGELPRVPPPNDLTAELPKQLLFTPSAVLMPKSTTFTQRGTRAAALLLATHCFHLTEGAQESVPCQILSCRITSSVGAPLGGPRSLKHTGKGGNYSQNILPEKSQRPPAKTLVPTGGWRHLAAASPHVGVSTCLAPQSTWSKGGARCKLERKCELHVWETPSVLPTRCFSPAMSAPRVPVLKRFSRIPQGREEEATTSLHVGTACVHWSPVGPVRGRQHPEGSVSLGWGLPATLTWGTLKNS